MNGSTFRYIFNGTLIVETGLHVGSGRGSPRTEATVVRDLNGQPYIPGSSFKGVLRSTVESLVAALDTGLTTCQLMDSATFPCVSVNGELRRQYTELRDRPDTDENALLAFLFPPNEAARLCHTCQLFGSPVWASKLKVPDLPLSPLAENATPPAKEVHALARDIAAALEDRVRTDVPRSALVDEIARAIVAHDAARWMPDTEVRHGVGIDRDTHTARERIKFDYEVVPPHTRFDWELVLERPNPTDLQLLALGLQEMRLGHVSFGGNTSRGTGRCRLEVRSITRVDLNDRRSLLEYLLASAAPAEEAPAAPAGERLDVDGFFTGHILALLGEDQGG